MTEVRTFAEGALRWVQASGSGRTWATASAAPTALVGFVEAGFQAGSAARYATIMERGIPHHHKFMSKEAGEVTFQFKEAVTGNDPAQRVATASGASVPMLHFELKSDRLEDTGSGPSGLYYQYIGCVLVDNQWTEGEEGNMRRQTWRYLAMTETGSGYLG